MFLCWVSWHRWWCLQHKLPYILPSATLVSITTPSIMTFWIITFSIKVLFVTLGINDAQPKWQSVSNAVMLSVAFHVLLCWMPVCWLSLCCVSFLWVSWRHLTLANIWPTWLANTSPGVILVVAETLPTRHERDLIFSNLAPFKSWLIYWSSYTVPFKSCTDQARFSLFGSKMNEITGAEWL